MEPGTDPPGPQLVSALVVARLGGFVLLLGGADYLGSFGVERRRGFALVERAGADAFETYLVWALISGGSAASSSAPNTIEWSFLRTLTVKR